MVLRLLVSSLVLAPALTLAAPERKTLDECIAIALTQQPTLHAASANVEAARERVWETTAAYLPQVGANYAANRRQTTPGSLTGGGGSFTNGQGQGLQTFNFYSTGVT